ncbi:MAG: fumarylacetoacetase [Gammaproteobacteria bacterium]|nr:fumarylacetoacetase [Gammaproteobacteria bacterium]MDH5629144.1 fumarylacetoacetase [Gammaproteobacteria bacterium]
MSQINETHDPQLISWVESANQENNDFPIQNLPFAVFKRKDSNESFRAGVAIGDYIVDFAALVSHQVFSGDVARAIELANQENLNDFMSHGKDVWSQVRLALSRALRQGSDLSEKMKTCLVPQSEAVFKLPCVIGDYTDFYASIHHATSVGKLFRPDDPLLPNYKWVPIGYHGRSSSIDVSGQQFKRPKGQIKAPDAAAPVFSACKRMDYEMEVGIYIGSGNDLGESISLDNAEDHVFGMCLLNDWSARDIQAWEYQPLGPFLAKNFASTVSPWIITTEALAPFKTSWHRDEADPQPLAYLESETNRQSGAFDIQLEVLLETETMREKGDSANHLSVTSFKHSYWTVAQMVTHHTVNGCNFRSGDMIGSGTQSGPSHEEAGSLLELSFGGKESIALKNGETRTFLEDGDTVIMRGWCEKEGFKRIGFGEATATILPAS